MNVSDSRKWFMRELEAKNYDQIVFGSSATADGKLQIIVRAGIFKEDCIDKVCFLGISKEEIENDR